MKNRNKLVQGKGARLIRDNVGGLLKEQGYQEVKGKKLKGEEYKKELYSLFLQEYKETLNTDKKGYLTVHYAEMLEVIRTLMVATKTDIKQFAIDKDRHVLDWYKRVSPSKHRLVEARIDLLQKFYELLPMKTEAIKDQLGDMLVSFKNVVESHEISFAEIEKQRREMYKRLGGYGQGVYLVSVSKQRTKTSAYSA